ncbi:hypothetical protein AQUCO_00900913v1 [Aquilegia coerulea]|uniref:BED-type domain-containing protein n=1 Tax=Aquilegia coerulea TaxID=218851 RepID=A0A2G5EG13_AQUCA|nr:hypothetical protein AQUCO_00900913v1 [Aquilegia coerulea]PIA54670.1 hypothetical protein AQUCO_00900913v1 [Aquilegia coerulea]
MASSSAGSQSQPVPIGSLKHDPAWKHVQMYKNGDRVQLKCLYCLKIFSGGGIHRIKEHLACQKGNASCCPTVPPEVTRAMLQSLEGVIVKKKKKQQMVNGIKSNTPDTNDIDMDTFGTPSEMKLVVTPSSVIHSTIERFMKSDEGMSAQSLDTRKRGRVENSSSFVTPDTSPCPGNLVSRNEKDEVHMAISRFLYDVGLSPDAANSPYFQPMIDAIATVGPGFEAPSYHDLRGWILKNSVHNTNALVDKYKAAWGRTGCSVLADEWTTENNRTLINIFIYCPEGTMFLRSFDVTDTLQPSDVLYDLLKGVVEEIGVNHVVQVITDSGEHYINAGKKLTETFRTMYWTPCAARSINMMLEDMGRIEWINVILERAKSITRFVYNHGTVLNLIRRYTGGRDLVQPSVTRSATDFFTLKSMVHLKGNLQVMLNSQEWMDCPLSKHPDGMSMMDIILSQSFWEACSNIIRLTDPLVGVLRSVDSSKRPAMGHILASMHHVKEAIKNELFDEEAYLLYWNIINSRWDEQVQHPLHEAGFFLNPGLYYSLEGDVRDKIPSGMLDCIERLVPDINIQDKINKELISYKNAVGDFGRKMAIRAAHTLLPAEWWSTYGGGCPNLARLAIRILNQTCSASFCKLSSIPFEQVHRTKNHLERQRLSDLVFVQCNLRLQQTNLRKYKDPAVMDPISTDSIGLTEDWVTEKMDFFGSEDSDWVALHQPVNNSMLLDSPNAEPENLVAGFDYQERPN